MTPWYELTVKAPPDNDYTTPEAMKRVEEHIAPLGGFLKCDGKRVIVQEPDGTFLVRVLVPDHLDLVKGILFRHYGLDVLKEEKHE